MTLRIFYFLLLNSTTISLQANDLAIAQSLSAEASKLMIDLKHEEAIPMFRRSLEIRESLGVINDYYYNSYTLLFLAHYDLAQECKFLKEEPRHKIRDAIHFYQKFKKLFEEVAVNCLTES